MPGLRASCTVVRLLLAALAICACASAVAGEHALLMPRADESLLLDIARAGERLVAVGERGHVLLSGDEGRSWTQAPVPTRAMLTAVWFNDERAGWAVGHDGVVLRTRDGGLGWDLQRDGLQQQRGLDVATRDEARARLAQLQADGAAEATLAQARLALEDAEATLEDPVFAPPLFDVRFEDAQRGIAVGAFGTCLVTTDGGMHWEDARARFDNPEQNHLYAITASGQRLLVAGESGRVFVSDDRGASWRAVGAGHHGTLFGLLAFPGKGPVYAFGLEGALLLSTDSGASWNALHTPSAAALAGATLDADGTPWIVGSMGTLLRARLGAVEQLPTAVDRAHLSAVIATNDGALVVVGQGGARRIAAAGG